MINAPMLLSDLGVQVRAIEADLRQSEETVERLRADWEEARRARQTATVFEAWLSEQVTQAASAWVLAAVLVRFCEDNQLIDAPYIAGPGERLSLARDRHMAYHQRHPASSDRDWLLAAVESLSISAATVRMFDPLHHLMSRCPLSPYAAHDLLTLWRRRDPAGHLLFDFTDGNLDTRFLGDLYQDLSAAARSKYALLQTPEFIADFILGHTLDPAIEEFGLEPDPPYEDLPRRLRFIDPACGSGTFLLGGFRRLLGAWESKLPRADRRTLVVSAIESVHGADKSPIAVVICRFRLLVTAMRAAGWSRISEVPVLPFVITIGDSLIPIESGTRGFPGFFNGKQHRLVQAANELIDPAESLERAGSYHAVATNPPYITVKDRSESDAYRAIYPQCRGMFSLVIPFVVRCFELALHGSRAGFVGTIVSNSFMKREFGRPLVEEFLPTVDLSHVIDTSGAYIPGHGTPTVILFGRARPPRAFSAIRAVLGARGEPTGPVNPAHGLVWQAITGQVDRPGSGSEWVSVADLDRKHFARHPWNLSGGGGDDLVEQMAAGRRSVSDVTARIGIAGLTGADDAFTGPADMFRRLNTEAEATVPVIFGSDVRDWEVSVEYRAFLPRSGGETSDIGWFPGHYRRLWPVRTLLRERRSANATVAGLGHPWYSWLQFHNARRRQPRSIVFSRIATHPHFAILCDDSVPLQSAPVITLPDTGPEDDLFGLAGLLNSSAACFWLRYHTQSKAAPTPDQLRADEEWGRFHEFGVSHVRKLPLPKRLPTAHGHRLNRLAQHLRAVGPGAEDGGQDQRIPTGKRSLEAKAEWERLRRQMIAWQEELDWDVYHRYGLLTAEQAAELTAPPGSVPELALGERAFEIVLARRMRDEGLKTQWFARHKSIPITEIPTHWPVEYQAVIERRIAAIERSSVIGLIERPECKRRWQSDPWEGKEKKALTGWLLNRCEERELWYGLDGTPRPLTVNQLADRLRGDGDVVSVARALKDDLDAAPAEVLAEILADEHVPYLASLRYKDEGLAKRAAWERTWELQRQEDATGQNLGIPVPPTYKSSDFRKQSYWRHRGKLDVSKERFISYPDASPNSDASLLLGWAGWDHKEQALAIQGLIEERAVVDGWPRDRIVPLLAGLAEVMPWVKQWHDGVDPTFGQCIVDVLDDYLATQLNRYQLTADTLNSWTAPPVRRGRPPKRRLSSRETRHRRCWSLSRSRLQSDDQAEVVEGTQCGGYLFHVLGAGQVHRVDGADDEVVAGKRTAAQVRDGCLAEPFIEFAEGGADGIGFHVGRQVVP